MSITALMTLLIAFTDNASWECFALDIYQPLELDHIALGPDGETYVAHVFDAYIHVIDPDGNTRGKIGAPGQGPGELDFPSGLEIHGDALYVHHNGGISVFERDGRFLRTIRPSYRGKLAWMKDGWVVAENRYQITEELEPAKVYWSERDLRAAREIHAWQRDEDSARILAVSSGGKVTINYNPAPEDLFLIGTPEGDRCYLRAPRSHEIMIIENGKPEPRRFLTLRETAPAFNETWADSRAREITERANPRQQLLIEKYYPDTFPLVRNMYLGPDGNLYIERWSGNPDKKRPVTAYDRAGDPVPAAYGAMVLSRLVGARGDKLVLATFDEDTERAGVALVPTALAESYIKERPVAEQPLR